MLGSKPIAIVLIAGLAACSQTPEERRPDSGARPNIVLVTMDTVRADHTSLHGYDRPTTPFLEELAAEGIRFDRAYATSSWTVPSIASLLSSMDPGAHGVTRGFIQDNHAVGQQVLSDTHTLFPELLREAGYRTIGVTANRHLTKEFGFAQGFDRYRNVGFGSARRVRRALRPILQDLPDDAPWFLWVHFFDPHGPYEERLATRDFLGEDVPVDPQLLADLQQIEFPEPLRAYGMAAGDETHRHLTALYDGEIHYVDWQIRDLLREVRVGADDIVIVTADHGEEFVDHGDFWHAHTLYEETIRVPLVLRLPAARHAGSAVDQPVSLTDIGPTLLDLLGLDAPPGFQGRSLLEAIDGTPARPFRVSLDLEVEHEGWIDGRFKYIHDRTRDRHELFDLVEDPLERTNLFDRRPDVVRTMRRSLDNALAGPGHVAEGRPLSDEHVEQLRSLGYVN